MTSAVLIGASFAGLMTAAALARSGLQVTVLERDELSRVGDRPRDGVAQSNQPHILLRRGLTAIEQLLPGVEDELLASGGVRFNTGRMPWLSEYGWLPANDWAYEITSISRPLLEAVVRRRVAGLAGVELVEGVRVEGLRRDGDGWLVSTADGEERSADLVIDASGRSSRLPQWLAGLGVAVPEPEVVEAKVGYATRRYRVPAHASTPLSTGVAVAATPEMPVGGLALPIENDEWLMCAVGYGERRPSRRTEEFEEFLAELRDPLLADLAAELEPVGEVMIHRQTANRRQGYTTVRDWPAGLLVVGDALCAFNPVYGQGITVASMQAALMRRWLGTHRFRLDGAATRVLQRRLAAVTDLPWAVATAQDVRMPSSDLEPTPVQRINEVWTTRMSRLAAGGDEACARAFARVYHLMGSPWLLFSPPVVGAVLRSVVTGVPQSAPRPEVIRPVPKALPSAG